MKRKEGKQYKFQVWLVLLLLKWDGDCNQRSNHASNPHLTEPISKLFHTSSIHLFFCIFPTIYLDYATNTHLCLPVLAAAVPPPDLLLVFFIQINFYIIGLDFSRYLISSGSLFISKNSKKNQCAGRLRCPAVLREVCSRCGLVRFHCMVLLSVIFDAESD